eukprot:scaffold448094_cov17-Prasinocladus_malaysianus.AAC.2
MTNEIASYPYRYEYECRYVIIMSPTARTSTVPVRVLICWGLGVGSWDVGSWDLGLGLGTLRLNSSRTVRRSLSQILFRVQECVRLLGIGQPPSLTGREKLTYSATTATTEKPQLSGDNTRVRVQATISPHHPSRSRSS